VALEKVYRDDLDGELVADRDLVVFMVGRVGWPAESFNRVDVGPASLDLTIRHMVEWADEHDTEVH
jgi:hypothetical protein